MNNDTDGLNNQPKRKERDNNVIRKMKQGTRNKNYCVLSVSKAQHKYK